MKFGAMFFASSEDALVGDKYQLVLETAKFADRSGFESIWVPERHFTKFGSLYPNPAVLQSAVAMVTERIRLQAGSVVVPLHHPLRIAEEWSMVDNLSRGRVGISFASGWNPNDFTLQPDRYESRQQKMVEGVHMVQRLWSGEKLTLPNGVGERVSVGIYPSPIQARLPIWVTAAGNPKTYQLAGELGANLLTHILDQELGQLADKIRLYRESLADNGHDPESGQVTLMLHTYVGDEQTRVREEARGPFVNYIKSNLGLLRGLAKSRGQETNLEAMSERDRTEFVGFLYERFAESRGLIGTPESCEGLVKEFSEVGVDEIACLLDFGPEAPSILDNLPFLDALRERCERFVRPQVTPDFSGAKGSGGGECVSVTSAGKSMPRQLLGGSEWAPPIPASELWGQMGLDDSGLNVRDGAFPVGRVWRRDNRALAEIGSASQLAALAGHSRHPAPIVCACAATLASATLRQDSSEGLDASVICRGFDGFEELEALDDAAWILASLSQVDSTDPRECLGDVKILSASGDCLLSIAALRVELVSHQESGLPEPDAFSGLTYSRQWQPVALSAPLGEEAVDKTLDGVWVLFAGENDVAAAFEERVNRQGGRCRIVRVANSVEPGELNRDALEVNEADPESFVQCLHQIGSLEPEGVRGIIHMLNLDTAGVEAASSATLGDDIALGVGSLFHLMQGLNRVSEDSSLRSVTVSLVTRGAFKIGDQQASVAVTQAPAWALGRVIALEMPRHWGGLLDVDPDADGESGAAQLEAFLRGRGQEDLLAYRAGESFAARLVPDPLAVEPRLPISFSPDAAYVVSGGLGGLGLTVVEWLLQRGAGHVALVGRRDASHFSELRDHGAQVLGCASDRIRYFQLDLASAEAVETLMDSVRSTMAPVKGVFHLAGILDDGMLRDQTWSRFVETRAAKGEGTWHLHQSTLADSLDWFVMFSSVASLVTLPGQGNYASANGFLDAMAAYRHSKGLPATCVNWGPWGEVGHAQTDYGRRAHEGLKAMGIEQLSPAEGLAVLERLMLDGVTQAGVVKVDWETLFRVDPAAAQSPLFRELVERYVPSVGGGAESGVLAGLSARPVAERREALLEFLTERVAAVLKFREGRRPDPRGRLFEMGLDSLMALELKNGLERDLGIALSATLLFRYPTLDELCDFLLGEALGESVDASSSDHAPAADEIGAEEELLVAESSPAPGVDLENGSLGDLTEEEMMELVQREIDAE